MIGMTNPEYVNPGYITPDDQAARQEAYDRQQELASRSPLNAVPDIVTNAEAEKAAEQAKAEVKEKAEAKPARRTAPKADASNK